jgi:hypothetical protein
MPAGRSGYKERGEPGRDGMTAVLFEAGGCVGGAAGAPGIGVMLLPSLYTPHPGVNATIAPSGLSIPPSPIDLHTPPGSPWRNRISTRHYIRAIQAATAFRLG